MRLARRKELQRVNHAQTRAADAWAASALLGTDGDSQEEVSRRHDETTMRSVASPYRNDNYDERKTTSMVSDARQLR